MSSLIEDLDVFYDENTDYTIDNSEGPTFGILFDIDGVLARGLNPLPQSKKMIELLKDEEGELKVPIAFVTNGCSKSDQKAKMMSDWLKTPISTEQVIHAQSPLSIFHAWHNKHILFIGQGAVREIAEDLGFKNIYTLDQIQDAYPLLDMVDHSKRKVVANGYVEKDFPIVEGIISMGEPVNWESNLQLLLDLLVTNGKPDHAPSEFPNEHLPILACNMDFVFMAEACMPRFGHGSFLVCLEGLYEKLTGNKLKYTAIIGKPSEITYRYAEHTITRERDRMGIKAPLKKLYFLGDNPEVDIAGANLYNRYLRRCRKLSGSNLSNMDNGDVRRRASVAESRQIPEEAQFSRQSAQSIDSVLVSTGVFNPQKVRNSKINHSHRDFEMKPEISNPTMFIDDCFQAVEEILRTERFNPKTDPSLKC